MSTPHDATQSLAPPLSEADKIAVFKACTRALPKWYPDEVAAGMTDAELATALERVIGILGGSSAHRGLPAITYKGAGLKIWASWHDWPDMKATPIFEGKASIALARQLYRIPDPNDGQMTLF